LAGKELSRLKEFLPSLPAAPYQGRSDHSIALEGFACFTGNAVLAPRLVGVEVEEYSGLVDLGGCLKFGFDVYDQGTRVFHGLV